MTIAMMFRALNDSQRVSLLNNDGVLYRGTARNIPIIYFDYLITSVAAYPTDFCTAEIVIVCK